MNIEIKNTKFIAIDEVEFNIGKIAAQHNIPFNELRSNGWKIGWQKEKERIENSLSLSSEEQANIRVQKHMSFMNHGISQGWWESVSSFGDPVPNPIIIKISELGEHENTMAHIMAKIGVFDSVSDARKNGWNKPITKGELWVKKKTIRIRIDD